MVKGKVNGRSRKWEVEVVDLTSPVLVTMGWHGIGSVTWAQLLVDYELGEPSSMSPYAARLLGAGKLCGYIDISGAGDTQIIAKHGQKTQSSSATDILTEILSLQDVDGTFEINGKVACLLGIKVGELSKAM